MNRIMRTILIIFTLFVFLTAFVDNTANAETSVNEDTIVNELVASNILKVTAQGQEVVDLQMRLRDLGYFNYKVTGYFGTATLAAVKNFQEINKLSPDGTVGSETQEVLYSCSAIRETVILSETAGMLPVSRGGRSSFGAMIDWFKSGQYLFPKQSIAKVTDLYTGISFKMKRTGGTYHADSEPVSTADAKKIKQIWGGWSWDRRPVILDIGGDRIAASMHGMPHAYDFISDNGMQGHVCIHMFKSKTHIGNAQDPDHQAAVRIAAGKG